jgi:hypothetical protein
MSHRPRTLNGMLIAVLTLTMLPLGMLPPVFAQAANANFNSTPTLINPNGQGTYSLALGDLNSDGLLDVLLGASGGTRGYLNDGRGGFTTTPILPESSTIAVKSMAVGDIDGDGDLDAVLGNAGVFTNGVFTPRPSRVYLNDGTGAFSEAASPPTPLNSTTRGVALGDLDGDGDLDLVLGNSYYDSDTSTFVPLPSQVYLNDGLGNFAPTAASLNPAGSITRSVALADLNGDGQLDIVLGNVDESRAYFNAGGGNFTPAAAPLNPGGAGTESVAVADLDRDNDQDIVLANGGMEEAPQALESSILLNDGTGAFNAPISPGPGATGSRSVAIGDIDGDRFLDLVFTNTNGDTAFKGDGAGAFADIGELPTVNSGAEALALGDINNDGALDAVFGNSFAQSLVYFNTAIGRFAAALPLPDSEQNRTTDVALGDLNGDGALDIVLNDFSFDYGAVFTPQPSRIYLNDGQGGFATSTLLNPTGSASRDIALGDLDGDGDLDALLGNSYTRNGCCGDIPQPSQIYFNNGSGTFTPAAAPLNPEGSVTTSVALGDLNGDGALDIVLGNKVTSDVSGQNPIPQPSQIYFNNGTGGFSAPGVSFNDGTLSTSRVILGDLNGDGALDIVLGNDFQEGRAYFNDGAGNFTSSKVINPGGNSLRDIAVGDFNADGALDVVIVNQNEPGQLYVNDGQGNFSLPSPPVLVGDGSASSIAVGDLTGDGALDMVLVNNTGTLLYINNGKGRFTAARDLINPANEPVYTIGVGDVSNDGIADVVLGLSFGQASKVFLARQRSADVRNNSSPHIKVGRPDTTANGTFYFTPDILTERYISFPFTLFDAESDLVSRVRAEYSLDGGGNWLPALPQVPTSVQNLAATPTGTTHTFTWDTSASGINTEIVFGQSDNVVLRLFAIADIRPQANQAAGPYQYGGGTTLGSPFRLRGTLTRVVSAAQPNGVAGALVYRLPAGQVRDAKPLAARFNGQAVLSNLQGYVTSRDPLQTGDRLAALLPITRTTKYDLYYSSPIARDTGAPEYIVQGPGPQTLTVSPNNPLILFKLAVTLEWDARNDLAFMNQLRQDLLRTSELLYDWTDGQAALGATTIYQNKERWEDTFDAQGRVITPAADIQIYATNRLRPNATQGGITLQTVTDPGVGTITYDPGQVRMGATWNRNGNPGGTLGEDWPRTLAHELGHYALYLEDNYLGLDAAGRLISVGTCKGAMADPYRDDYSEFHPAGADWDATCASTLSERITGRSDWETIDTFYKRTTAADGITFQLNLPATFNTLPGPIVQALNFTTLSEVTPATPDTARTILLNLTDASGQRYVASSGARAVRYSADGQRAIDLGVPSGDQLLVRGAVSGDTVCVTDNPRNYVGCTTITAIGTQLIMNNRTDWQPDLQITPVNSTTVNLAVPAAGVGTPAPATINATLFPEGAAPVNFTLTLNGTNYTGTTGQLPNPVLGGVMRIAVPGEANSRTALADYSLGGDPAPRQRPKRKNKKRAPALSADGQAILFTDNLTVQPGQFYAFQSVDRLPPAPGWAVPVGLGYRLLASDDALRGQINRAVLALSYFEADVPFNTEEGLQIYYLAPGATTWQALETRIDPDENTVSTVPPGEGLYAIMASIPLRLGEAGWNLLFSYPGADQALPEAFAGAAGRYSLIYGYESDDADDPWKAFAPAVPDQWASLVNDLTRLENGRGYWIRASQPVTVPVRPITNAMPTFDDGILNAPPATYYGIAPITSTATLTVEALIDEAVCGTTTTQQRSIDGATRTVYSLNVLANGTGAAEGCGSPGAPVTLNFLQGTTVVASIPTAWDNSAVIELRPGRVHLPMLGNWVGSGPTEEPTPDLEVVSITVVPANPVAEEPAEVQVAIRNSGSADITRSFWVDLYVDPETAPEGGIGWPEVSEFGASWRVYGIQAGQTIVLSTLSPNDPLNPGQNYSNFSGFPFEGQSILYAQVDAYGEEGDAEGAIAETNEENNIAGPITIVVAPPAADETHGTRS